MTNNHVVRIRCCSERPSSLSTGILCPRYPPPWETANLLNQPLPDPALLNTDPPTADNIADDAAKVNLVSPDFKQNPATETSVQDVPSGVPTPGGGRRRRYIDEVEREGFYVWNLAKQYLLHPGVAGGLIGLGMSRSRECGSDISNEMPIAVNVGLVSGAAYKFYNDPYLRRDTRAIVSAVAGALTLLGAEGYAAEKYRETPRGQREADKVKREGAAIYRTAREHILRPGVLGGLLGVCKSTYVVYSCSVPHLFVQ